MNNGWIWPIIIIVTAIVILVAVKFFIKYIKPRFNNSGIDSLVGSKCVVTEKIDNYAGCGQVRINGQIWSARGILDDDLFDEGQVLDIVAIEGVKLICKM